MPFIVVRETAAMFDEVELFGKIECEKKCIYSKKNLAHNTPHLSKRKIRSRGWEVAASEVHF